MTIIMMIMIMTTFCDLA